MTRLRKLRSSRPCNCEKNLTGKTIAYCRCGRIGAQPKSEEDPTASPAPKKPVFEKQEEADVCVAVLGSSLLNSQKESEALGSNASSWAKLLGYPLHHNVKQDNIIVANYKKSFLTDLIKIYSDDGTFVEILRSDPGDLILVGEGKINGRRIVMYAHQLLSPGNPILEKQGAKIVEIRDYAWNIGVPMLGIERFHGVKNHHRKYLEFVDALFGAVKNVPYIRIQEGAETVSLNTTDYMLPADFLFSIGELNDENNKRTHRVFRNSHEAKLHICSFVKYLPQSRKVGAPISTVPWRRSISSIDRIIFNMIPCDVRYLINCIVDNCEFFELQPRNAGAIIIGLGQLQGMSFAIIANNPNSNRPWNEDASHKAENLLNFCWMFKVPLIGILDRHTLLQEYKRNDEYMKRFSTSYNKMKGPVINVITRTASKKEEDDMASKMFKSNRTFIWKTKKNFAFDKAAPNCETIAPTETRHKVCRAMRML